MCESKNLSATEENICPDCPECKNSKDVKINPVRRAIEEFGVFEWREISKFYCTECGSDFS